MNLVKRRAFISYYKQDIDKVEKFIDDFKNVFTPKILGANDNDDFIDSSNTNYVMQCIRDRYLEDSTVTIVLLGTCTHSRRYIDWEIKSSLQQGKALPNGLIGIALSDPPHPFCLPARFANNLKNGHDDYYARYIRYPTSEQKLRKWIEDAHLARTTRAALIDNSLPMAKYNLKCKICKKTHL